jgi:hypothetical protein
VDFAGLDKFARVSFYQTLGDACTDLLHVRFGFSVTVPDLKNGADGFAF